jgi:hypothetical protein
MLPLDVVAPLERRYREILGRLCAEAGASPPEPERRRAVELIRGLGEGDEPASGEPRYEQILDALAAGLDRDVGARLLRELRPALSHAFAYAVPNGRALDRIAASGRVVELGAGGGYWARCLAARGAEVAAFDRLRPAEDGSDHGRQLRHHLIRPGGPAEAAAELAAARALLLCWPPGMLFHDVSGAPVGYSTMGMEALDRFAGDTVVFVGERSKSFGSPAFFRRLGAELRLVELIEIRNLGDWRDAVHVFERRAR